MKINFTQSELFQMVQAWLGTKGMTVPAEAEGIFEVVADDDGQLIVSVEAEFATAPSPPPPVSKNQGRPVVTERPARVGSEDDPRTQPGPPPDPEESQGSIRTLREQSKAIQKVGPVKNNPARQRFPKTIMGATIEDLGKSPEDMSDEIA